MYIHPSTHPYSYLENTTSALVIEEAAKKALQVVLRLEKEADIGDDRKKSGSRAIATATTLDWARGADCGSAGLAPTLRSRTKRSL
jgi:hypothetical protein